MHPAALIAPLLAMAAPAQAGGTALWLEGAADPTALPGARHLLPERAQPAEAWGPRDDEAIAQLRAELLAVRPLLDVFDGELQVLRRIDAALDAVEILREEDRALVHEARALQGLAAWRYFQDALATAPEATAWRVVLPDGAGGTLVANRGWVDAIAVDPDTLPSAGVLPDDEARLAYQELRARLLVLPDAVVVAASLPPGARLLVDGRPSPGDRARLVPGQHRILIEGPAGPLLRQVVDLQSGQQLVLDTPADAAELRALAPRLDGVAAVALPPRVQATLARLEQPVTLLRADGRQVHQYRVADGAALPLVPAEPTRGGGAPLAGGGLSLRLGVSSGWVWDGEWYLLHAAEGAPPTRATVNGTAPGLSLSGGLRRGLLAASVGMDARFSVGQWQYLDVGDSDQRARLYPHVGVGLPWLQATVGAALPWRLGLGARFWVPVAGPVEVTGGTLWELGLPVARPGDLPGYDPGDAISAWGGLGLRLGQ